MNLFKDKLRHFLGQNRTFDKKDICDFYTDFNNKSSEQDFFGICITYKKKK